MIDLYYWSTPNGHEVRMLSRAEKSTRLLPRKVRGRLEEAKRVLFGQRAR
jgi:hypothetical protein